MDKNLKEILQKHGFTFKKAFGQNFLTDQTLLNDIVIKAGVTKNDTVLEIGPGAGALTKVLSDTAKRVVCYEIDTKLKPVLEDVLYGKTNVEIVFKDVLKEKMSDLLTLVELTLQNFVFFPVFLKILAFVEAKSDFPQILMLNWIWILILQFLQMQVIASDLDGPIQCTQEFEDAYTQTKNDASNGKRYANTLRDDTRFIWNVQLERNGGGYFFDGYESKGRNVAIELVGNPIYQGANDTYYNVDKNGTKHPPQPQIWSCKDIYLTLTLGDIKCHMNGEPSYSQLDINNSPLEF